MVERLLLELSMVFTPDKEWAILKPSQIEARYEGRFENFFHKHHRENEKRDLDKAEEEHLKLFYLR